jgi:sarcosine oxidase subunit gamma
MSESGAGPTGSDGAAPSGVSGQTARTARELVLFEGLRAIAQPARFSLRGELSALASALAPAGTPVSQTVCGAVLADGCVALWLGPDEQLLLVQEGHVSRVTQLLTQHLACLPHSLVDISHRQVAFEITGSRARTLLATGCPLDLREEVFPVGMCTRTIFEKCEIVLWRSALDTFHVEVGRSFASHVTALLAQAARELDS